ncbi:helix-turn-helix transcriptional regulator [Peribacillus frigoritolerans]|uniref:helix-turn-helix domain-containing protein n=1 Tax=Peribacillus frigoritolerans TaxID=450367 RepID=UPI002E1D131B|nr:helix-turn-helix transcriptional regulator [Peribacillus frigoritolerans]
MSHDAKFGERLKSLRDKYRLRQLDLALLVKTEKYPNGIPKSTLAGYENGFRRPNFETLVKISEVLNTSADYLIGATDDPSPAKPTKDLRKLLQSNDFHIDGKVLTNDNLKFAIEFLEKLAVNQKNDDEIAKEFPVDSIKNGEKI